MIELLLWAAVGLLAGYAFGRASTRASVRERDAAAETFTAKLTGLCQCAYVDGPHRPGVGACPEDALLPERADDAAAGTMVRAIRDVWDSLTEREQQILRRRYGRRAPGARR